MNVDSFVTQLAEAAPRPSDLERSGLVGEAAHEFIRSFLCVKRDQPSAEPSGSEPVLELLRNWDLSKVEIGMVRFPGSHVESSGTICLGCVEADPLVLLPNGGEIVVHELGTKEHILWHVAKNGSALLEALVVAAGFLGKRAVGSIDFDDYETARTVALECATVAGGNKFTSFFKMLLGAA